MSLLGQETTSAGSMQFPIDNLELTGADCACEAACNGPVVSIPAAGHAGDQAEPLCAIVCSTTDLLQAASLDIEPWMMRKAARAAQQKLATALIGNVRFAARIS